VLAAIDRDQYDVVPIGITPEGRWALAVDDAERLAIRDGKLPSVDGSGASVVLAGDPTAAGLVVHQSGEVPRELGEVDVVLPLLHGPYGEDGTLQGLLELAGVPYVGSGVLASAASMDKAHMKLVLAASGLPVGPYVVVRQGEWQRDPAAVRESVASLHWPVFVKPARSGSSIGVSKVNGPGELDAAIEQALLHDPKLVIEAGIVGREVECGVLEGIDGGPAEASVVGEIRVIGDHEFYDFEAKYLDNATELDVPADLPASVADEVRKLAVAAFEALGCESLARVDFFATNQGQVIINEVNTMPGFTPVSMFPMLWAASGLDYPRLVDRLVGSALKRQPGLR
jgi:D-alanine-D-alanine ligase